VKIDWRMPGEGSAVQLDSNCFGKGEIISELIDALGASRKFVRRFPDAAGTGAERHCKYA
jgi:hypothetical protein